MKRTFIIFKTFANIFFKDRVNLFLIFFFNAFLMIIFGISIQDKYIMSINLGIIDKAQNDKSRDAIQNLSRQPNIIIKEYINESELHNEIKLGQLVAGIIIDQNSTTNTTNLQLLADPSRKMWIDFLEPVLKLSLINDKDIINNNINLKTEYIQSTNLRFFDFIFPGLLIFSIMQVGMSGGIMLLVQKKSESLKRLQITPLKKWEFLLGYISCYLCIMILQVIGYILLAYALFDYVFIGNYFQISFILIFTSLFFIGLGILLCNFSSTIENGNNFNRFFIFPASFLCGVFIPISTLPSVVQKIALIHPLTYFVDIMRSIANYGQNILNIPIPLIVLSIVFILIITVAIRTFKWQQKNS